MQKYTGTLLVIVLLAAPCFADEHSMHNALHEHAAMNNTLSAETPLTEAGNDAFAAIQEVVNQLMADPNTDWQKVDLEALRQHLVDMDNFTLHVKVVSQKPIEGGVEFVVQPTTPEADGSLQRLFTAHPAILKQETGWDMVSTKLKNGYRARVTSSNPKDVTKIRGLGYIGLVALGKHHQLHHWQMATGINPHQHQH